MKYVCGHVEGESSDLGEKVIKNRVSTTSPAQEGYLSCSIGAHITSELGLMMVTEELAESLLIGWPACCFCKLLCVNTESTV